MFFKREVVTYTLTWDLVDLHFNTMGLGKHIHFSLKLSKYTLYFGTQ